MKKLLRPKDILLLGLAGALDVFEEIKDPLGLGTQKAEQLYQWVPRQYKRHNFSRVIERVLRTKEIEKVVKDDQVYIRLTAQGEKNTIRDFPMLALAKQKWDKKWRVVIFDIKEVNRRSRDLLRYKLKELGFGMLQESVWITPHNVGKDMHEYVETNKMGSYIFVLEVEEILAGDRELLVNKMWKIYELNKKYSSLLEEINKLNKVYVNTHDRDIKHTNKIRELKVKYLEILVTDPCLPKELLPEDWAGEKVRKAMGK